MMKSLGQSPVFVLLIQVELRFNVEAWDCLWMKMDEYLQLYTVIDRIHVMIKRKSSDYDTVKWYNMQRYSFRGNRRRHEIWKWYLTNTYLSIYIKICSSHSCFATWKVDAWQTDTCPSCIKRSISFNLRICWAFIARGISIVFWATTFWLCMRSVGPTSITLNLMKQRNVGRLSPFFCGAWKRLSFFQISET